jgi:hypothetical protein
MRRLCKATIAAGLSAMSLAGAVDAYAATEEPAPTPTPTLPPLSLQASALHPGKRAVRIMVATSYEASVLVYGQVGWGIKTKQGKHARLIVALDGGRQTVSPGQIASFEVKLPKSVLRRLHRLTPRQSLKARIAASATDASGRRAVDRVVVKLKGLAGRR